VTGGSGHGALPPTQQAIRNLAATLDQIAGFGTPRLHPVIREQFATLATTASGRRPRSSVDSPPQQVLSWSAPRRAPPRGWHARAPAIGFHHPDDHRRGLQVQRRAAKGRPPSTLDCSPTPTSHTRCDTAPAGRRARRPRHQRPPQGPRPSQRQGTAVRHPACSIDPVAEAALPHRVAEPRNHRPAVLPGTRSGSVRLDTTRPPARAARNDPRTRRTHPVDGFRHAVTIMSDVVQNAASCSSTPTHRPRRSRRAGQH
jgi:hypothetical protein